MTFSNANLDARTILFDMDGTLVDVSCRHFEVYKNCLQELGYGPLNQEEYWALKRSNTAIEIITEKSGLPPEKLKDFKLLFRNNIETPFALALDSLFPDALDLLSYFEENKATMNLISLRRNPSNLLTQVENLGLKRFFRTVMTAHSDDKHGGGVAKASALKSSGYLPSPNDVFVGDTEADIHAGLVLGVPVFAVSTGLRNEAFLLRSGAHVVLNNLESLKKLFIS